MKKTAIFVLLLGAALSAQVADTLVVPDNIGGNPLGAINITIEGDTTAAGTRVNPNRVYKLLAGKVYYLNGPLTTTDYHLKLIGEKPTPEKAPAVLILGVREDGSVADNMLRLNGNFTLKNIYFMGMAPNGAQHANEDMAAIYGDNIRGVIENCIFEQNKVILFGFYGSMAKAYAYNNIIRNSHQLGVGHWNGGRFIWIWDAPADSVVIVNNTWVNNSAYLYTDRDRGTNYVKIEHNTCLNSCAFVFFLHTLTNASISNNVFYNCQFTGEFADEFNGGWNDYDGMPASIVSIDTLYDKGNFKLAPFAETDRAIKVNNNVFYMDPLILSAQEAAGNVKTEWMNSRTQAMFADKTTWPKLESKANQLNEDPSFVVNPTVMDSILYFIPIVGSWAATHSWAFPVDGKPPYIPDWPIPENLSYSNDKLLTAAEGGFPVGDLNWFPEKKKEWEQWVTSVRADRDAATPKDFTLKQNYPNPFNPATTISFELTRPSTISLAVYNVVGQKVKTLIDGQLQAGVHEVVWDATDTFGGRAPSGLYYCRLEVGSYSETLKMLLLK